MMLHDVLIYTKSQVFEYVCLEEPVLGEQGSLMLATTTGILVAFNGNEWTRFEISLIPDEEE